MAKNYSAQQGGSPWRFRLCRLRPYFFILLCFLLSCNDQGKTASDHIKDGIKFTKEQQYDQAISAYKKAIKSEPKNAFAYYALGGMYTLKNMHEKAIKVHKKAIELDPDFPDPHYSLGFVYEKLGRKKEAEEEYSLFKKLKKSKKIRKYPDSHIM